MAPTHDHSQPLRGLVLAKYGDLAASTRQRFVQAMPYLAQQGITLTIAPLFDNAYLLAYYQKGTRAPAAILSAYLHRFAQLLRARHYDFLIVQYELFPYLPGFFERLPSGIPVLVDMDDAMFHQYDLHPHPLVRRLLGNKMLPLLRRSQMVLCGNAYLAAYARPHAARVEILPTTVDITRYQTAYRPAAPTPAVIGWIGSPSTWRYCAPWHAMLATYAASGKATFTVIGAGSEAKPLPGVTYQPWSEAQEVADIQRMDIGIMPLPDEAWARGKCGYKLIQYMACGLPVVASAVGANRDIVTDGTNGFLANSEAEWLSAFDRLVENPELRLRMGAAGRSTVEAHYAIQVHGPRLAQLIRQSMDPR